ncbi:MAG: DUF2283 domain-containing protein [Nitrososphaera sp.]
MRIEYDKEADAAYIYLTDQMPPVARMYRCDPVTVDGMINLDFHATGQLIGIEVLVASKKLSRELLSTAKRIDKLPDLRRNRQSRNSGASGN